MMLNDVDGIVKAVGFPLRTSEQELFNALVDVNWRVIVRYALESGPTLQQKIVKLEAVAKLTKRLAVELGTSSHRDIRDSENWLFGELCTQAQSYAKDEALKFGKAEALRRASEHECHHGVGMDPKHVDTMAQSLAANHRVYLAASPPTKIDTSIGDNVDGAVLIENEDGSATIWQPGDIDYSAAEAVLRTAESVWLLHKWADAGARIHREQKMQKWRQQQRGAARSWLFGVGLRRVYETHFGRPAGSSQNLEGQPSGPYIRFVEAFFDANRVLFEPEGRRPRMRRSRDAVRRALRKERMAGGRRSQKK